MTKNPRLTDIWTADVITLFPESFPGLLGESLIGSALAKKLWTLQTVNLRDPLDGEVEVQLKACAICHSDISYIDGGWGGTLPAVYGHEAAGFVDGDGNK